MLYSCGPAGSSGGAIRTKGRPRGAKREHTLTVDIHCHLFTPEADALTRPAFKRENDVVDVYSSEITREVNRAQMQEIRTPLTSIERRLRDMDKMGIDIQAISPSPPQNCYWAEPDLALRACRLINDRLAEVVAMHPDRFVALGAIPMQAPDLAAAELERLVKDMGFRGVELLPNVDGAELSEKRFRKVFAKAEELGAVVFLHPNGFTEGRRLADHYFINVIGNPLDSTVAVSHLIFGGVLDACPKLKVVVAHGGGYLPAYSGRIDHVYNARADGRQFIKKKPTSYLKKLYFDTIVFTTHQLEYLVEQYGADHIMLGTDYPYDMGMYDPVGFVGSAAKLTRADRAAIVGGNAAKLLKIKRRK